MSAQNLQTPAHLAAPLSGSDALGIWLVLSSALVWSFGGTFARLVDIDSPWVTIFWRAGFAAIFLMGLMLWQHGRAGTGALFRTMGWPGLTIAACFAVASTTFIVAVQHTTIANVLLMQAGVPLIAAFLSFLMFREKLRLPTWIAIAAVIAGVVVMISDSLTGKVSPIGDGLALLIAVSFALATVITRRYAHVRMTPAVFLSSVISCGVAGMMALGTVGAVAVELWQIGILVPFGISLGLGMALFSMGARLIPSAMAALLGTAETILGPFWVWLFLAEVPSLRTVLGGGMVLCALIAYLLWQMSDERRKKRLILAPTVN